MNAPESIAGFDSYPLQVRRWLPDQEPRAQLIILHGMVSHSQWLAPIAERIAHKGFEVICPDRRGSGLNTLSPGDAPDQQTLLEDVHLLLQHYHNPGVPLHLAGFCWGAVYALSFAFEYRARIDSLVLIAPSVFMVDDVAKKKVIAGDNHEPTETPVIPLDRFTHGPDYENFILPDPLRTRLVSRHFNSIMRDMAAFIGPRWTALRVPTLMILADRDRLSDNAKLRRAFALLRASPKRLDNVDAEHGVQFDAPDATAGIIADWLQAKTTAEH